MSDDAPTPVEGDLLDEPLDQAVVDLDAYEASAPYELADTEADAEVDNALASLVTSTSDTRGSAESAQRKQSRAHRKQITGGRMALLMSAIVSVLGIFLILLLREMTKADWLLMAAAVNGIVAVVYFALYAWSRSDAVNGLQLSQCYS